jgi:hypothetical protein
VLKRANFWSSFFSKRLCSRGQIFGQAFFQKGCAQEGEFLVKLFFKKVVLKRTNLYIMKLGGTQLGSFLDK